MTVHGVRLSARATRTMPEQAASPRSSRSCTWSTSSPSRRTSRWAWSGAASDSWSGPTSTIAWSRRWRRSNRRSIPSARVSSLSVAQKQIVEIARAASSGASVIIMDEPTAALSEREVERLFGVIRRLRESDVTVIYISHKLDEIFELGDAVTVLRDGKHIATKPLAEVAGRSELIRDDDRPHRLPGLRAPRGARDADTVLTADGLTQPPPQGRLLRHRAGRDRRASTGSSAPARPRSPGRSSGPTSSPAARSPSRVSRSAVRRRMPSPRASRWCPRSGGRRACSPAHHPRNIPVMNMRRLSRRGHHPLVGERAVAVEYVAEAEDRHGLDREDGRQAVRRQPAEGRAVEVPVRRRRPAAAR